MKVLYKVMPAGAGLCVKHPMFDSKQASDTMRI